MCAGHSPANPGKAWFQVTRLFCSPTNCSFSGWLSLATIPKFLSDSYTVSPSSNKRLELCAAGFLSLSGTVQTTRGTRSGYHRGMILGVQTFTLFDSLILQKQVSKTQCRGGCLTLSCRFLFALKNPAQGWLPTETKCCRTYISSTENPPRTHLLQGDGFELQLPQLGEHLIVENSQKQEKGGHPAEDICACFPGGISRKKHFYIIITFP